MNKTKDQSHILPKIGSQKRMTTALNRQSALDRTEPHSSTLKRTHSATTYSSGKKLPAESKKVEELRTQLRTLDHEVRKVENEIHDMKAVSRKTEDSSVVRVKSGMFLTETTMVAESKASMRKNINPNDERALSNQISATSNKIEVLRKKVDEQKEKNEKVKKQVDAIRKQIQTLKNLSKNVKLSLCRTNQEYSQYVQYSRKLDEQIANKNSEMHKVKVESQHKKAEVIGQYDKILTQLDKQLSNKQKSTARLLPTPPYERMPSLKAADSRTRSSNSLNKGRSSLSTQITALRHKLDHYQKQFQNLKEQTGVQSTEQVISHVQQIYEQHFSYYQYINQLYAALEEKQRENDGLRARRHQLMGEVSQSVSQAKHKEMVRMQSNLEAIRREKEKYGGRSAQYEKNMQQIKEIIIQFYQRVEMGPECQLSDLSEHNISQYLAAISERCTQLEEKYESRHEHAPSANKHEADLGQMLESIKKESIYDEGEAKLDRIMSRNEFIRAREAAMRKKGTPRKNNR